MYLHSLCCVLCSRYVLCNCKVIINFVFLQYYIRVYSHIINYGDNVSVSGFSF